VDQVKQLLALSYRRFEAICHETHCYGTFRIDQRELRSGTTQSL